MKEIVGAMIGSTITNDRKTIHDAVASGRTDIQFLDRRHMQFMANCDLGKNWEIMATGPTLFLVDNDGVPRALGRRTAVERQASARRRGAARREPVRGWRER